MKGDSHGHSHSHSQGWVSAAWLIIVLAMVGSVGGATLHTVGDSKGWTLPARVNVSYTAWAANNTFRLGDSILFVYNSNYHNVEEVSAVDYNNCTTLNVAATYTDGNTTIPLNKTGMHYYICSIQDHCAVGQKVAINVLAATATSPSASPSTSPSTAPSSSPSTSPPSLSPSTSPSSSSLPSNTSASALPPSGASSSKPSIIALLGLGGSLLGTLSLMLLA